MQNYQLAMQNCPPPPPCCRTGTILKFAFCLYLPHPALRATFSLTWEKENHCVPYKSFSHLLGEGFRMRESQFIPASSRRSIPCRTLRVFLREIPIQARCLTLLFPICSSQSRRISYGFRKQSYQSRSSESPFPIRNSRLRRMESTFSNWNSRLSLPLNL